MDDPQMKDAIRWMWSLGDYGALAAIWSRTRSSSRNGPPSTGSDVLDVAAGNGNFAIAAARLGATVVATDLTPAMVELGRARTRAHGLTIEWLEADAESLPFAAGRFDVVGPSSARCSRRIRSASRPSSSGWRNPEGWWRWRTTGRKDFSPVLPR